MGSWYLLPQLPRSPCLHEYFEVVTSSREPQDDAKHDRRKSLVGGRASKES
jgi:hypothetical protein